MFRSGRLKPTSIIFLHICSRGKASLVLIPLFSILLLKSWRRSADGTPGGGSPPAEQDLDYSTDEDLSCRTCCLIAGRRRRVGACELVCCRPLNVIKIITSKKSLVISFVVHSWFCQSELRFCQIKVNLLAGHLEMTGKQIYLNLKNRKTNRLLAHTILRFYGSTFQNGQTVMKYYK